MDYESILPETIDISNCPECGIQACIQEVRYGYPSPQYIKNRMGYLERNYWPSANIYYRCCYCGMDEPEDRFKYDYDPA